jgi:tetratricopeptide (TPR) repeat protein
MKAIRLLPAAAVAACLVFSACSDYVGKESTHPLYAKAMTAKSSKSYREAAESLEEFLTICPKSPKAHYDVALIYKENLENYPAAIYHLLKYLELSGETISKEDQAAIRSYVQTCEQRMFEAYRVRNDIKLADDVPQADPAKLASKNAEILALREKLQKYVDTDKALRAQNEELRKRLENAASSASTSTVKPATQTQASGAAASSSTATAVRSGSVPSSTTGTPGTTVAGENGVRYSYVGKGEGLQVIAQKMYGKVSMWKTIQEANNLPDNAVLKLGQRLVIPPKQ